MGQVQGRILIADDEKNIRGGLRDILRNDGYFVVAVKNGQEALEKLRESSFDVAILDIQMPQISGIDLLKLIDTNWPDTIVIILTGHGKLETAIEAVKAGAYEYLLKPALPADIRQVVASAVKLAWQQQEEKRLLQNIRASLNRLDTLSDKVVSGPTSASATDSILTLGLLQINFRAYEVRLNGIPIQLSPTEYKVLFVLASQPDTVFSYAALAEQALGYSFTPWEAKELVKRHIFTLRKKIEPDPAKPRYILNVRGVGYRLIAPQ